MCNKDCNCYLHSDEYKAYKAIEDQVGTSTPDEAWALYFVSEGAVREDILMAVMTHIANGNQALVSAFPQFANLYEPK